MTVVAAISGNERVSLRGAWVIAAVAAGFAMLASFLLIPAFFPTNDDPYIQQILSGGVSGEPSPYVMFVNFVLCWAVSRLFIVAPGVPWWVLTHLALLFLAISLVGRTLIVLTRRILPGRPLPSALELLAVFFLDCGLFSVLVARMQFTTTSTVLFAAAIFSTCCWGVVNDKLAGSIVGRCVLPATLAVFGSAMRGQSGLVGFFFWGLAAVASIAARDGGLREKSLSSRLLIASIGVAALVSLGLMGVHEYAYSSPEWSSNRELSRQLAAYTDYERMPYGQNSDVYDSVGWGEDLVELTGDWFHMDERVNEEALSTINVANNSWIESLLNNPLGTLLSRLGEFGQPTPMAYAALLMTIGILALSGARRKSDEIASWVIAIACIGLLAYLVIRGRLPERAAYSVMLPATAALASIFARGTICCLMFRRSAVFGAIVCVLVMVALGIPTGGTGKLAGLLVIFAAATVFLEMRSSDSVARKKCARISIALVVVAMLFPVAAAVKQYGWWSENYALMSSRQSNTEAFYDYVEENDDKFFFYANDAGLTPQYVWQSRWPKNQTAWGGWRYCYSWFADAMKEAGFGGLPTSEDLLDDRVRFVCSSEKTLELLVRYLRNLYGDVSVELETTVGSGINVYRLWSGERLH